MRSAWVLLRQSGPVTGTIRMKGAAIGIDFGTTNSSIACCVNAGPNVEVARFPFGAATTESYRSLLYLEHLRQQGRDKLASWTGPAGIERYLEKETAGRLI